MPKLEPVIMDSPLRIVVLSLILSVTFCHAAPDRFQTDSTRSDRIYYPGEIAHLKKELVYNIPKSHHWGTLLIPFLLVRTNTTEFHKDVPKETVHETKNEKVNYRGAQLWKVPIDTDQRLKVVFDLTRYQNVSTWGGNHRTVDLMIRPTHNEIVSNILYANNISYSVTIDDLQRYIDEENPEIEITQDRRGHRLTWQQYHRLSDIHDYMDYLAKTHSFCSVKSIGKSHEGRDLKVLRISNGGQNKKAVWIDGGIHAREWISPATVTYIMNHIVENFDSDSDMLRDIEWYFLPVVNPDGYEYTHTIDRLWRKNRKRFGFCSGVDLNRNFGYRWGGKGTSQNPCSEVYSGPHAFSESESRAIKDFMDRSSADFKLYVTYHSYGQYILFPWGYDKEKTVDHDELDAAGNRAANAIYKTGGSEYEVGVSSILLYPAAGGSDDWAKGDKNIKYSYTIELNDKGKYGFILPASQILSVAKESVAGLMMLVEAAYRT